MRKAELFATNPVFWVFKPERDDLIPAYNHITAGDLLSAYDYAVKTTRQGIAAITRNQRKATPYNTIDAYDRATALFDYVWALAEHLRNVSATPDIIAAGKKIGENSRALLGEFKNNRDLYNRAKKLQDNLKSPTHSPVDRIAISTFYDWFDNFTYTIASKNKKKLAKIDAQLSGLEFKFEQNVRDAEKIYRLVITDPTHLSGLSINMLHVAKENAMAMGLEKAWAFDGTSTTYLGIMRYADHRALRERYYNESNQIATQPPHDNTAIFKDILKLRYQQARMNGRQSHANSAVDSGMLHRRKDVYKFLNSIKHPILRAAYKERKKLEALALLDDVEKFEPWDADYYQEKLRTREFKYNEESLQDYFGAENVLTGLLHDAEKLYGLKITENHLADKWDENVRHFDVYDAETDEKKATLSFDLFARPDKADNCYCAPLINHGMMEGKKIIPAFNLVFNFSSPPKGFQNTIGFLSVESIQHELAHALHGIFNKSKYRSLSGIEAVIEDFIELPSQLAENRVYEDDVLDMIAKNPETGEKMPDDLKHMLKTKRTFMGGTYLLKYLKQSFLDMEIHSISPDNQRRFNVVDFERATMRRIFKNLGDSRILTPRFTHIATMGMGAGYYRYLYSEAHEACAYQLFKQHGIYDIETARRYKAMLAKSSQELPEKICEEFRGGPFSIRPLLERYGLTRIFNGAPKYSPDLALAVPVTLVTGQPPSTVLNQLSGPS